MIRDFISLLYPNICLLCGNTLFKSEQVICTFCYYKLPKTNFHLLSENPVTRIFWGRTSIRSAASFLYYAKGNMVQQLIHQFKYRGNREIGYYLGRMYGRELLKSKLFNRPDLIIPVPLHPRKQRQRGFNQSGIFAAGLSETLKTEVDATNLFRRKHSETQTRKSKYERWQNVSEIFELKDPEKLAGKYIILVDDVITTGSTLEACVNVLKSVPAVEISIVTIALAK